MKNKLIAISQSVRLSNLLVAFCCPMVLAMVLASTHAFAGMASLSCASQGSEGSTGSVSSRVLFKKRQLLRSIDFLKKSKQFS